MRYGFVNNFKQALAADLATGATSMTLDGGGALLAAAALNFRFPLTLVDGAGNIEIVYVRAASGNTLTIVREQEGTVAPATWPSGTVVECRLTAVIASGFAWGEPSDTVHFDAVSIQPSRGSADQVASGTASVAIGARSKASGNYCAVIGYQAAALANETVTIGGLSSAPVSKSTAVGYQSTVDDAGASGQAGSAYGYLSTCNGAGGAALGAYSNVEAGATKATAVGWGATASAPYSTVVGNGAEAVVGSDNGVGLGLFAYVGGEGSMALGHNSVTGAAGQLALGPNAYPSTIVSAMNVTSAPMVPKTLAAPLSYQHAVAMRMSLPMLVRSDDAALGTTGDKGNVTWPTGALFFIEAIDVIVISSAAGGATPTINVGTTVSGTDIVSAYSLVSDAVGNRERILNTPHGVGVSAAHFSVGTAAASAVTVRFVLHGYMMET